MVANRRRRATCGRRTRPAWPRCRRRSSRGTPRSGRVTGVPAGTPRARVNFTRCGADIRLPPAPRPPARRSRRHQPGVERRAGQLVEPAGGGLARPGDRRPTRAAGRDDVGDRDDPGDDRDLLAGEAVGIAASRRSARGGGGSRRRPGRAPRRATPGRRRASTWARRSGESAEPEGSGGARTASGRATMPTSCSQAPTMQRETVASSSPAWAAIAPATRPRARRGWGDGPRGRRRSARRRGRCARPKVGHEAEVGVVGHLSDIGALRSAGLETHRQAGTAAAIASRPADRRGRDRAASASTACSGWGIRPKTCRPR